MVECSKAESKRSRVQCASSRARSFRMQGACPDFQDNRPWNWTFFSRASLTPWNSVIFLYNGCNYDTAKSWERICSFRLRRSLVRSLITKFPEYDQPKILENGWKSKKLWLRIWVFVDFNRMLELFSLIDATIIGKSRAYTLVLKDLYDPLNPDKDTVQTRQNISIEQYKSHFLGHLRPTLRKAKYNRVPQEIVESMAQYVEIPERGLQVKIKLADYELVEMWYKGELFGDRARLASREPHESIWKFLESQWVNSKS